MQANEIAALVVFVVIGLGLVGMSIPLMMGKGASLIIAGYNTMSPEERTTWDSPALARFLGKILLACGLATALYGMTLVLPNLAWATWVYFPLVVGLSVFAVVWCNTGKRFRK